MKPIILVAETGSDVNQALASQYDIQIVPMHVSFEEETLDDGGFPVEQICEYYKNTGKLPKTSGSTPEDFEKVFDRIHELWPEAEILYLAYSAVTTCSYQSAAIASEHRDYVTILDTKQVSAGQCNVVIAVAEYLQAHPGASISEAVKAAEDLIGRAKMCFLPDNLEFLRAGGRVSNAAFLGARILNLRPCIELLDGRLMATKKYRGKMMNAAVKLIQEYTERYRLKKDRLWMVYTVGLAEDVRKSAEAAAAECGYAQVQWIQAGGVITTHGGPAAFGIAGFSEE